MAENEENRESIPPIEQTDEAMTEEQHERQTKSPGRGHPADETSPEGETPSHAESTPPISGDDQGEGESH
jgi:hypothetical protein